MCLLGQIIFLFLFSSYEIQFFYVILLQSMLSNAISAPSIQQYATLNHSAWKRDMYVRKRILFAECHESIENAGSKHWGAPNHGRQAETHADRNDCQAESKHIEHIGRSRSVNLRNCTSVKKSRLLQKTLWKLIDYGQIPFIIVIDFWC